MLLRHSLYYVIARGLPGLVGFVALALYTRLLTTDEFGRFAVALAGVSLVEVIVFQWLRLVAARFVPASRDGPEVVQRGIVALFLVLALVVVTVSFASLLLWKDRVWGALLGMAGFLVVAQGWFQLELVLASVKLQPGRYGCLLGSKSILAVAIGGLLALQGWGAKAPIFGLLVGSVAAWLLFGRSGWRGIRPQWPSRGALHEYCSYGVPLVATFALGWVIISSDRLIVASLIDEAASGVYAAGYDLAQQTLGLMLLVVNVAAYPLVINKLEEVGADAARVQLQRSGELIVALAFGGAAGLVALAPALIDVVVGPDFRPGAMSIMPWIAVATALAGIKAFHFDIAFHLARKSKWLVVTGALAAIANVVLNVLLIPRFGIVGAAWATLAAFSIGTLASGLLGRRVFSMPKLAPMLTHALLVATLVYLGASCVERLITNSLAAVMAGVVTAGILGISTVLILNVAGARDTLVAQLCKLRITRDRPT